MFITAVPTEHPAVGEKFVPAGIGVVTALVFALLLLLAVVIALATALAFAGRASSEVVGRSATTDRRWSHEQQ